MIRDHIGYYENHDAPFDLVAYEPPMHVPCPFCGRVPLPGDRMGEFYVRYDRGERVYFYRAHASCHAAAREEERVRVAQLVLDTVEAVPPGK